MIINIKYENHKKKININNYESILSIKNKFFNNDISLVKNTLFYRNGVILENNDFIERDNFKDKFEIHNKNKGGSSMLYWVMYYLVVFIIVMIPPIILSTGIIPATSTFLGLILEKSFKTIASYLKCNYGKKTLVGRFTWIFSGILPYIIMGLAIYIIITFPLMILCTSVKGKKILDSPTSICSPVSAASMSGLVLICFYYMFYFLFRFFDWFIDGVMSIVKLNYSIYTTIGPWIQSIKDTWDTSKYVPVYIIPFVGQGLMAYHETLGIALAAIEVVITQIKELGCSKILNKNFFMKQIEDKVKNSIPNNIQDNVKSYSQIASDASKTVIKEGPKMVKEGAKELYKKAKERKIQIDKEKSNKSQLDSRDKNINKYRNYIEEKEKTNNNSDNECTAYDNPCCSKENILTIADGINELFHLPPVQMQVKNYRVYNGFILTIQAFFEEAMRLNEFNEELKQGPIPNKKIYFKRVLKTQNDLISDKTKKLLTKYLYETNTFDEGVNDDKLMDIINQDISKHNFDNKEKVKEIKYKIAQLDQEGKDYAKSLGASYDIGGTLVKIILKRVCIETACNIFNTTNSAADIMKSMGQASDIVELFKASSSTGTFITIFYLITVIVLIILGLLQIY